MPAFRRCLNFVAVLVADSASLPSRSVAFFVLSPSRSLRCFGSLALAFRCHFGIVAVFVSSPFRSRRRFDMLSVAVSVSVVYDDYGFGVDRRFTFDGVFSVTFDFNIVVIFAFGFGFAFTSELAFGLAVPVNRFSFRFSFNIFVVLALSFALDFDLRCRCHCHDLGGAMVAGILA